MKKLILPILLVAALCLVWKTAPAAPTLLMGSLVTVNNTTSNSPAVTAFSYNPTLQQFSVTHGALTSTGALTLNIQATVDQTNYVTIGTWTPSYTNATTETFSGSSYAITNYIRVQAVTTNSVQIGGSYGQ
jgi:hypothetical protein